jgi:hypothetical protein
VCLPPSLWKLVGYSYSLQKLQNLFHSIPLAHANGPANKFFAPPPPSTQTKTSVTFGCGYLMLLGPSIGEIQCSANLCHIEDMERFLTRENILDL